MKVTDILQLSRTPELLSFYIPRSVSFYPLQASSFLIKGKKNIFEISWRISSHFCLHGIILSLFLLSIGSWVTDCFEPALVRTRHWHSDAGIRFPRLVINIQILRLTARSIRLGPAMQLLSSNLWKYPIYAKLWIPPPPYSTFVVVL